MSNGFAEFFARVEKEYGEELNAMPLPDGLPEHLAQLINDRDQQAIQLMLKIAWQMGAQAGVQAGLRLAGHDDSKVEFMASGAEDIGGMKA